MTVNARRTATRTIGDVTPFEIAHFSDTHLGYEAYEAESPSGQNQRGEDIVRAFNRVVDDILAADPPLVIHSGDVAEKPVVPIQYLVYAMGAFERLTHRRDGSIRPVIVIAGNHDPSHRHRDACWLELLRVIPNVHVVTTGYDKIRFTDDDIAAGVDPVLADVIVHAIPHDSLRRIDNWDQVRPTDGKVNILTTHGVAHGLKIFTRALGREYAIPNEVLARRWEYVALGHYHKRGPVAVADGAAASSHVWYAGSPEYISFRDLKDNTERRGYLRVTINPGDGPTVHEVDLPTRAIFRLPAVDATGLEPVEITDKLIANIAAADISGAVVGQIIEGVTRDTYSLVEKNRVRDAAAASLYFELVPRFTTVERDTPNGDNTAPAGLGDIERVLDGVAADLTADGTIPADLAPEVTAYATNLLRDVLSRFDNTDNDTAATGADTSEEPAA